MESDPTIPTPFEAPHDNIETGPTTPVSPVTATSYAISRVSINIEEEGVPKFSMDVEEKELHADPHRPLRSIKKRSSIWEHFIKIYGNTENLQAQCHYCGILCSFHSKKQGTSVLISHLQDCQQYKIHKREATSLSQQIKLSYETTTTLDGTQSKKLTVSQYSKKQWRKLLVDMIIMDEMPFMTVEREGFRKFCNAMESQLSLPSRYTVIRDCMKMHAKEKLLMKKMFSITSQRVSPKTNIWTSIQNITYICVTAHWIDSGWTLHKRIIRFKQIEDYKGASIGAELDDAMKAWGIKKLLCVTVNNTSANDTTIDWLRQNTTMTTDTIWGNKFMHIQCAIHILNFIVREGLKKIDDSILKVRDLVQYVNTSPQRLDKFKTIAEQLHIPLTTRLCLEVPNRWNSIYMMLEVAEKYQKVFERMEVEDGVLRYALQEQGGGRTGLGPPDTCDWTNIRCFIEFLKLFYKIIVRMSSTQYCTANVYFEEIMDLSWHFHKSYEEATGLLHEMVMRMKLKFNKYWGDVEKINRLLFVAAILDPRRKLSIIEFWMRNLHGDEQAERFITSLKLDIEDLYSHYSNGQSSTAGSSSQPTISPSSLFASSSNILLQRYYENRASRNIFQCKSEVDIYFMEDIEELSDTFHILTWWKVNSTKYPVLSQVARDVLVIPITTVASESVFSTGGCVLDAYRSSLAPSTLEALICTQNWLHSDSLGLLVVDDIESYRLKSDRVKYM